MKRLLAWLLPVCVLLVSAAIGLYLIRTAPEITRKHPKPTHPAVETITAQPVDYTVTVQSRGTVSPRTQGALVSEVAGRILEMSAPFRPGGFFEAGETLAILDATDYHHALTMAQSELAQARLTWKEEKAREGQAKREWKKSGLTGQPGELTLRTPQRLHAQAALAAAKSRLAQAERDLKRTRIVAPYAGRVLDTQVDVGQYVARGTPLATVYAVDHAEVRLPLTDRQTTFLTLPERFRDDLSTPMGPQVTLSAILAGQRHTWQGRVVRTEGAIDPKTRQIHVVAQVDNPYGRGPRGRPPLKVGQFVHATLQGQRLTAVFLVPRAAFRNAGEVLTLTPDNRIQRRSLQTIWRDATHQVVRDGLTPGERIVVTSLPYAPDGMQVETSKTPTPSPDTPKQES